MSCIYYTTLLNPIINSHKSSPVLLVERPQLNFTIALPWLQTLNSMPADISMISIYLVQRMADTSDMGSLSPAQQWFHYIPFDNLLFMPLEQFINLILHLQNLKTKVFNACVDHWTHDIYIYMCVCVCYKYKCIYIYVCVYII